MPTDRLPRRLAQCVGGLAICGLGIALIVQAELGVAPWDVLHQGVSERTGIPIGTVIVIVGFALLLLWIPLRVRPGVGTVLNAVVIGLVVDLALPRLPDTELLVVRVPELAAGIVMFGVGTGLYIGTGLGPGPRDGLMIGLVARGWRIQTSRTVLEVSVLVVGFVLGGSVGLGTAAFAFGIGPLVQFFLPRLRIDDERSRDLVHLTDGAHAGRGIRQN